MRKFKLIVNLLINTAQLLCMYVAIQSLFSGDWSKATAFLLAVITLQLDLLTLKDDEDDN